MYLASVPIGNRIFSAKISILGNLGELSIPILGDLSYSSLPTIVVKARLLLGSTRLVTKSPVLGSWRVVANFRRPLVALLCYCLLLFPGPTTNSLSDNFPFVQRHVQSQTHSDFSSFAYVTWAAATATAAFNNFWTKQERFYVGSCLSLKVAKRLPSALEVP